MTTNTNAIAIYIAGLECSKAKHPECPAAYDLFIEQNWMEPKWMDGQMDERMDEWMNGGWIDGRMDVDIKR